MCHHGLQTGRFRQTTQSDICNIQWGMSPDYIFRHQLPGPGPLRVCSHGTTLHWHKVNVKRMSTLLNLRPDNTGNIVLIFSRGNRCMRMFHWRGCDHTCCHITLRPKWARWRPNPPASSVCSTVFVVFWILGNKVSHFDVKLEGRQVSTPTF